VNFGEKNDVIGNVSIALRRLAFEFAIANKIPSNFNPHSKMTGKDWLYRFMKRNPEISLRQPQGTSLNRISSFNETEVKLFFSNLQTAMDKISFPPHRVFNVNETGISVVPKKSGKILASKDVRNVGVATSAERGRNITVVCSINASGTYVPHVIIFPRKRLAPHLHGHIGTVYRSSDNGWITEELTSPGFLTSSKT